MSKINYLLPIPSTALLRDPEFQKISQRNCVLICEYEDEDGNTAILTMFFEQVEAFRCTYYKACSLEIVEVAYDKVVDLGNTKWLEEIKTNLSRAKQDISSLYHLAIYFDDGPAYEFICRKFRIEIETINHN